MSGGALKVARAGPPPNEAGAVVLAVHGISASHAAWRTVARELTSHTQACLLAPDLRGRGHSATLPDPYGMTAHLRDLNAVLDHAGADRAVMVGHSMGAHVVARLAADHPERLAGIVLVDGGMPFFAAPPDWDEEPGHDPTAGRMESYCESRERYIADWRAHAAFRQAWNEDVEAFVHQDMVHDGHGVRCVVRKEAVEADTFDLMSSMCPTPTTTPSCSETVRARREWQPPSAASLEMRDGPSAIHGTAPRRLSGADRCAEYIAWRRCPAHLRGSGHRRSLLSADDRRPCR